MYTVINDNGDTIAEFEYEVDAYNYIHEHSEEGYVYLDPNGKVVSW